MRRHLGLLCLALLLAPFAVAQELPRGQVIEKVICRADATQSYALYLPTYYSTDRRWPILYGFDPGGRGLMPVERFREAAERYGYIVVGSHNSHNGPGVPLAHIVASLWEDTHARFAVDDRRAYATGMSGGARVAVSVGNAYKLAGVIGCGAGFPPEITPSAQTPFAFYGIVGNEDFNFPELQQLDKAFEPTGIPHQLAVFDGEHAWPPAEECTAGIEWMELQAMRAGRRAKDEPLIAALWEKGMTKAQHEENAPDLYHAGSSYAALAAVFVGLRDISSAQNKAQQLSATKEFKAAVKAEKEQARRQQAEAQNFYALCERLKSAEERVVAQSDLKRMIAGLRKQADAPPKSSERVVAHRLLQLFAISASEEAGRATYSKNYLHAALLLGIAAEIRPENPRVLIQAAKAYALAGEKRQAVDALRRAVEKGFTDAAQVAQSREFDALRNDGEFQKVMAALSAAHPNGAK